VVSMRVIRDIHSKGSKRDHQTESSVVNRRRVRVIKPVLRVRPGPHHHIIDQIDHHEIEAGGGGPELHESSPIIV
jgi:hypothetical protein